MIKKIRQLLSCDYRLAIIKNGMWLQYEFDKKKYAIRFIDKLKKKITDRPNSWTLYRKGPLNLSEREINRGNF